MLRSSRLYLLVIASAGVFTAASCVLDRTGTNQGSETAGPGGNGGNPTGAGFFPQGGNAGMGGTPNGGMGGMAGGMGGVGGMGGMGGDGGTGGMVTWVPTDSGDLHTWLRAEPTQVFSNVAATMPATNLGSVLAWTDQSGNNHDFVTIAAEAPIWQQTSANLGMNGTLLFAGVDERFASNEAATTWQFLHDGSGATVAFVWRPAILKKHVIVDSLQQANTRHGIQVAANADASMTLRVGNATGTYVVQDRVELVAAAGDEMVIVVRLKSGEMNEFDWRRNGVPLNGGAFVGTPSNLPPHGTLHIADLVNPTTTELMNGELAELILFDEYLSLADVQLLEAYATQRYGL